MKSAIAFLAVLAAAFAVPATASPVLVELFTSEGCSSCPPADALLEKLQGEDVIVLSEHVDYWNHIGWSDPYSSSKYSERQSTYASRFHLDSVYTPQMVIDGSVELVGSDAGLARSSLANAAKVQKASIQLNRDGQQLRIEVTGLSKRADVYLAVASNEELSKVLRGENRGRNLHHVAVVRSLEKIGTAQSSAPFLRTLDVPMPAKIDPAKLRIVVFAQESGQGRVLGSAMLKM